MSEKMHYWNSVVEVSGPQAHQVKRYNLTITTKETSVSKKNLESLITKGVLLRQEEIPDSELDQFRAVIYGPFYIGDQTPEDYEAEDNGG